MVLGVIASMGLSVFYGSRVKSETVIARIPGSNYRAWEEQEIYQNMLKLDAPQLPAEGQKHYIDGLCPRWFKPVSAWAEPHTSWPDPSVMYSVNAEVEEGRVVLHLRSRRVDYFTGQSYKHGYSYVDVMVLCVPKLIER